MTKEENKIYAKEELTNIIIGRIVDLTMYLEQSDISYEEIEIFLDTIMDKIDEGIEEVTELYDDINDLEEEVIEYHAPSEIWERIDEYVNNRE